MDKTQCLRAPKRNKNDKEFIKMICSSVMKMQFDLEKCHLKNVTTIL